MKKLILAIFAIAILGCASAHADVIDATVAADNNISYWNGTQWIALGNDWTSAETVTINVNTPSDIVYFAVSNDFTSPNNPTNGHNPAGFIGSFYDTSSDSVFAQTDSTTLLSSTSTFKVLPLLPWTITPQYPALPPLHTINPWFNPNILPHFGWETPTSYGTNSDSLWTSANGGPISGVDPNAEWLWTAHNDGYYGSENDYAIFSVNLGVVAPELPTLWLFIFAGALIILFNRKKLIRVA